MNKEIIDLTGSPEPMQVDERKEEKEEKINILENKEIMNLPDEIIAYLKIKFENNEQLSTHPEIYSILGIEPSLPKYRVSYTGCRNIIITYRNCGISLKQILEKIKEKVCKKKKYIYKYINKI